MDDFGVPPGTFLLYTTLAQQLLQVWGNACTEPITSMVLQTLLTHGRGRKAITVIYNSLAGILGHRIGN